MRRNIKVQPVIGPGISDNGINAAINRPQVSNGYRRKPVGVDDIVDEVDQEINKLTRDASRFLANIQQEVEPAAEVKGMRSLARQNSTRPQRIVYLTKDANKNEDEVEEIQFSHEVNNDEEKITNQLEDDFHLLRKQVEEYRKLYNVTNQRLKETEQKKMEVENKVEDLVEDNHKLNEQLRNSANAPNLFNANLRNPAQRNNKLAADLQQRSEELRRILLYENEDEAATITMTELWAGKAVKKNVRDAFNYYFAPFRKDIQKIQASFGAAVASYFLFYRFLFVQICLTACIVALFFIFHILSPSHVTSWQTYFTSPAYLPYIMLYSSYSPREGLLYDLCLLLTLAVGLLMIGGKLLLEDRLAKSIVAIEEENEFPYSKNVLGVWDHSQIQKVDVEDSKGHISNTLLQQLEETHSTGRSRARSQYQTFLLSFKRFLALLSYLAILFLSCTLILYVTISSDFIAKKAGGVLPGASNIQSFIAPFLLNAIAAVMPEVSRAITEFEAWDSPVTTTSIMLLRVYLSSLINILLLLASYMVLADPFLLADHSDLRNSFGLNSSSQYDCRMDQIGDGLFTLLLITWTLDKLFFAALPYMNIFYYHYIKKQPLKKLEFSVADHMVKKLNFMGYIFAAFIFAPPCLLFMPILLYVGFKVEKFLLKRHYAKPQRPFKGAKVGFVYTFFYLVTFISVACTLGVYFLTSKTFIKSCDIQDDYVHLCRSGTYDSTTQICKQDSDSAFYNYYKSYDYPKDLCTEACGAFQNSVSQLTPFHSFVQKITVLNYAWMICFKYPYLPWVCLLVLLLYAGRVYNTLEVLKISTFNKERAYETQLAANEVERKRQEKMIRKLKSIEGGARAEGHEE